MSDLVAFLRARLDEDESLLWRFSDWSKDRVLREVEAKRAILELHANWPVLVETRPTLAPASGDDLSSFTYRVTQQIAWTTEQRYRETFGEKPPTAPMIAALAAIYSDHPDYRDEWKP